MNFVPLKFLFKILKFHMDSNPQNGAHLGVYGFIPSHFLAFLGM
jgi:hypothetical protein